MASSFSSALSLSDHMEMVEWIVSTQDPRAFENIPATHAFSQWCGETDRSEGHSPPIKSNIADWSHDERKDMRRILMGLINGFGGDVHSPWAWWALQELAVVWPEQHERELVLVAQMMTKHPQASQLFQALGACGGGAALISCPLPFSHLDRDEHEGMELWAARMRGYILHQAHPSWSLKQIERASVDDVHQAWMGMWGTEQHQKTLNMLSGKKTLAYFNGTMESVEQARTVFPLLLNAGMVNNVFDLLLQFTAQEFIDSHATFIAETVIHVCGKKNSINMNHGMDRFFRALARQPADSIEGVIKSLMTHPECCFQQQVLAFAVNNKSAYEDQWPQMRGILMRHSNNEDVVKAIQQLLDERHRGDMGGLLEMIPLHVQQQIVLSYMRTQFHQPQLAAAVDHLIIQHEMAPSCEHAQLPSQVAAPSKKKKM